MSKTVKIEAEVPLPKDRPNLLVVVHPGTGRRHVLGDGMPLRADEYRKVHPPQERATDPLENYFTSDEKAELQAAEQQLERARAEAARLTDEIRARAQDGTPLDLSEPREIERTASVA